MQIQGQGGARLPGLLGKLGKMTAIRDTEVLEQSLLRTLGPLLGVLETSLYRTDEQQTLIRKICYHRSKQVDSDGVARVLERLEEVSKLTDLAPGIVEVTEHVRLLGKPCTRKSEHDFLIAYPLLGGGEICGYFVFQRGHEVAANEDTIIRGVLEVFSNYYALLDFSQRDRLTGLYNRQALENGFDRIWGALLRPDVYVEKAEGRRQVPADRYWLAVIDIDHFKRVNDSFGHMIGDEVLLLLARRMQEILRTSDLLYRYGGEEFIAIIAASEPEVAAEVFERLRFCLEQAPLPRVGSVTVSIGFAEISSQVLPVEVLSRADRCLYRAKEDGRNRVYAFHDLVQAGKLESTVCDDVELF